MQVITPEFKFQSHRYLKGFIIQILIVIQKSSDFGLTNLPEQKKTTNNKRCDYIVHTKLVCQFLPVLKREIMVFKTLGSCRKKR